MLATILISIACLQPPDLPIGDEPVIRFPLVPHQIEPGPGPRPTPPPQVVESFAADEWYVIESSVPLIILQTPDGVLEVATEAGPVKLRGKFADGEQTADGARVIESRTYEAEHLYLIASPQAGATELAIIPVGVQAGAEIIRQPITVTGEAPKPPPGPGPGPIEPDDVLRQCHAADRVSQIAILRALWAKNLPRDPAGMTAAKDFVNAERIRRRAEDFGPYTDAIGEAIFGGTVGDLADTLEGKKP